MNTFGAGETDKEMSEVPGPCVLPAPGAFSFPPPPTPGHTLELPLQAWGCGPSALERQCWAILGRAQVQFETQVPVAEVTRPAGRLHGALGFVRDALPSVSGWKASLGTARADVGPTLKTQHGFCTRSTQKFMKQS